MIVFLLQNENDDKKGQDIDYEIIKKYVCCMNIQEEEDWFKASSQTAPIVSSCSIVFFLSFSTSCRNSLISSS